MLACARGAPRLSVRIAVTGANSAVGQAVVREAIASADVETVACVRSDRAASQLPPIPESRGSVARIDFEDPESLRRAFRGSAGVIHLPGILIETRSASYESANVEALRCAIEAAHAEDVGKFVLVGAVGADPSSANPYFRSKGLAEQLLLHSGLTYTVVRAPLVLGAAAQGSRAFARETSGGFVAVVGGGRSLEQPLDVRDLAAGALAAAVEIDRARDRVLDLVGPESVPMREILRRGARLRGARIRIVPLPVRPVKALLALIRRLAGAGLSPDVIDVMQTDVRLDPQPAARALGIELHELDDTIRYSLENVGME